MARRLVEQGVPYIEVGLGGWDTQQNIHTTLADNKLPEMDKAMSALVQDLEERGLREDTAIIWMGEFGRSPRISKIFATPGREHWPHAFTILMAGAGTHGGLVHGATDRYAEYVTDDPVSPEDVTATIFDALGVDPQQSVKSRNKPHQLSTGRPLLELFS